MSDNPSDRAVKPARRPKTSPSQSLGRQSSPEAGRRAAAILEVLAGVRSAPEAAAALTISVNHYYLLERQALAGLLAACEPKPKGPRGAGLEKKLAEVERELAECRRECLRQAALVRTTQRAMGLPAAAPKAAATSAAKKKGSGRRRRRPAVRALQAAEAVRKNCSRENDPPGLEQSSAGAEAAPTSGTLSKEPHGGAAR